MSTTPKLLLKGLVSKNSFESTDGVLQLNQKLKEFLGVPAFALNSGRSAIYLALKTLGIGHGDEVLIQAYTCNAVPNPVLWTGAVPIYVDISETDLNMDLDDLQSKISPKAKAIIVQHTFGNPAKIREILKIAEEHNLKVIEDCAHCLGAKIDGKMLGTFGDLAIISFGREKIISSLAGGALVVNDAALIPKVQSLLEPLKVLPRNKLLQEIGNYFTWRLLFRKILPKDWGRSFIRYLYQFDAVNVVTSQKELSGLRPSWYPSKMPNLLAKIALLEFEKIENYNNTRREIAQRYLEGLQGTKCVLIGPHEGVYLRVVGLHPRASAIVEQGKEKKIMFGNWYNTVVYPEGVHLARLGYKSGSCPIAERVASETINLPNYLGMTENEVNKVIGFVKSFG